MYGDLLLALSGHPGSIFVRDSGGEFHISDDTPLLAPHEASLLNRILKIAKFYYDISTFTKVYKNIIKIKHTRDPPNAGLYTAALCFGLDRGLKPYRDTLIKLDCLVRENPNMPLSLLQFHLDKFQNLFPILAYIIDEVRTKEHIKGCGILELLHRESACGIPFVKDLLQELLQSCHSVFYQQLSAWVLHGKVEDHFGEFFIQEISNVPYNNDGGLYSKYDINVDMVPGYIQMRVVQTIHFIGSSVHIFGSQKFTSNPLQKKDEDYFVELLKGLQSKSKFCPIEFERVIGIMRDKVAEHLYALMMNEGRLLETLKLFKDFFLLGRGELFLTFIDSADYMMQHSAVKKNSDSDVNRLFLKAYTQLGFSNEDHVEKFRLKFVGKEHRPAPEARKILRHDDVPSRWNDLTLAYDVQWPLHVLFTAEVIEEYNKIFMFLLKLKRCQIALQTAWSISTRSGDRWDSKLLNLRSSVAFLIDQLQYYLHVDVLETNYTQLLNKMEDTKDFETIKQAHCSFLALLKTWTFQSGEALLVAEFIDILISIGFTVSNKFCPNPETESKQVPLATLESRYYGAIGMMFKMLEVSASKQHNSLINQLLLRLDYNGFFSRLSQAKKEYLMQTSRKSHSKLHA